jgi:hypothetical protein
MYRLKRLSSEIAHQLADGDGPVDELAVDGAEAVGEIEAELEALALDDALAEAETDGPTEPDADAECAGAEAVLPGDWLLPALEFGDISLRSMRKSYVGTLEAHQGDSVTVASPNCSR